MRQPITAPTMAVGFMGGVVLPLLITNAIAQRPANALSHDANGAADTEADYYFNDILF